MCSTRDLSTVNHKELEKLGHLNDAYPAVCLYSHKTRQRFCTEKKTANFTKRERELIQL